MGKRKTAIGRPFEEEVILKLRSLGIYATFGVYGEWKYVDVVAFGCVRIEVKTSTVGHFHLSQDHGNEEGWDSSDIVILVCRGEESDTFHIMRQNHPVFYRDDGSLKYAITYSGEKSQVLTKEIMDEAQDNWKLIFEVLGERLETIQKQALVGD